MGKTTTRKRTTAAQRSQRRMRALAIVGAIPVALVALYVSYGHIAAVTLAAGESPITSAIMALSVDGMMLTAGVAIMAGRRSMIPYLTFGVGMVASLAANVISAEGSLVSYVVAAWPALALTLTSELLLRLTTPPRPRRRKRTTKPSTRKAQAPSVNGHRAARPRTLVPSR